MANAAHRVTALPAFASRAALSAAPPKGMGRASRLPQRFPGFVGGPDNTDPVSLSRIPVKRAVRVGKQWFNSKSIRAMLARDTRTTNPLTRQPFPDAVRERYMPPDWWGSNGSNYGLGSNGGYNSNGGYSSNGRY